METIEDFLVELKSIEVSAHIWRLNTSNAAEITAISEFYSQLHFYLQELIELAISDAGWKEHGLTFTSFSYVDLDTLDIKKIVEDVRGFLQNKVRTPNGPFLPEIDKTLVNIIKTLSKFNYKMMLE